MSHLYHLLSVYSKNSNHPKLLIEHNVNLTSLLHKMADHTAIPNWGKSTIWYMTDDGYEHEIINITSEDLEY